VDVPQFDRHYRLPRATARFLWSFLVFFAIVVAVAISTSSSGSAPVIALPVYTVLALVAFGGRRLTAKGGMYETAAGLKVVNGFGSVTHRWDLIATFEQSRARPKSRVLIVGLNGKTLPIVGTAQGARITWDGGETNDIVGVLNQRLELWCSQRATTSGDLPSSAH
jgi:hypothetical protein